MRGINHLRWKYTVNEGPGGHPFPVLSGDEETIKAFYDRGRHSPVLRGEAFLERLRAGYI